MSVSFDRVAELYDRTRSFPEEIMEKTIKILRDGLKDCRLILDVGVGTGRFALALQNHGFEVVGVDISSKMMRKAIDKKIKDLMYADACYLPFLDLSFDASLSVHVLHLIKDWKVALAEITRVTKIALYSVLIENPSDTPRDVYRKLMKKYGYDYQHPGLGEWDFKDIVKPDASMFVASYEGNVERAMSALRDKAFSHQWNAPKEVHQKAISELEKIVAGTTYVNKVYVHRWNISKIKKHMQ
nr:class I SAM-dependent methyltransferase [Candidatus Njordarchaeota archaeon]